MRRILSLLLLTVPIATVLEAKPAKDKQAAKTITYENTKRGYSLQYPNDWTTNNELQGFDIFIMAPNESDGDSHANVSIISGDLPSTVDLELFAGENMKNLTKGNPTIRMIETRKGTINGIPMQYTHYTRGDDDTEITHYFFVINNVGYLITTGSTIEDFKKYQPAFERILNGFKQNKAATSATPQKR